MVKTRSSKRILAIAMTLLMLTALVPSALAVDEPEVPAAIYVSNGQQLHEALQTLTGTSSVTIELTDDIDAVSSATYTAYDTGAALTINGNGHTIDGKGENKTGLRFGGRSKSLSLTINNTTFTNMANSDRHGGGAIALWSGTLNISCCNFINNTETNGTGAGVRHQSGGPAIISNSTFSGNTATGTGAAINIGVDATLDNITVIGNTSATVGGINASASRVVTLTNSTVYGNSVTDMANVIDGGGNVFEAPKDPATDIGITLVSDEKLEKVFAITADINTIPVNLVELTMWFNEGDYNVSVEIASEFSTAAVANVFGTNGERKIVIGVTNENAIGNSGAVTLAYVTVTPTDLHPSDVTMNLNGIKAYSLGESVQVNAAPGSANAQFDYLPEHNPLDVNNDGEVTLADLSLALYYFGTDNKTADVNGDGIVDIMDITTLVNYLYA